MKAIDPFLLRLVIRSSFVLALLYPHVSFAATCDPAVATAVSVQGSVDVQRSGGTQWQPVRLNDTFCAGDTVRVNKRSRADLAQANSVLRLNANTTLTLQGVKKKETSLVDLGKGAAYFFSLAPRSIEVVTPTANAAVRGTEFFIRVEEGKTFLTIFEGEVVASNPAGTLTLARGQSAVAEAGRAPVLRLVARPKDAVRWTLYYPPVVNVRPGEFPGSEFYQKGDLRKAFDSLETLPEGIRDPRFFTYLASLELSVGRVDAADKNIRQALSLDSNHSDAFALQAIIAVAQNDKDTAFSKAQQAVQADPKSATAQIALSYAQQAKFDLDGALTSLQIAVQLEPENALAWARLAELWSAHGNLDKSLEAAQKAVSLNPNLSRTQTVLGFAQLIREDTGQARAAFQKAIEFDQGDPLPKLGLGLAKIRDDELTAGRKDIEEAVSLDPENSIMRSYLGKAYYEEKRSDRASDQFARAKENDPNDPTPYLYDAVEKQTTNRPVEALFALQTAIELNNNRAPYRSKLLLDSDLASRSAALGRIYTDLGFQKRALLEGWLSVNTDPTNFSAHRFLADSYSSLPRHEIARVSELLQSQLLQPINMTPIQPRLGESNLFLISAQGPGALSFNEFNPLFKSNGITFQGNSIVGSNDTYSGEGIISGIFEKASFSVGYSKFDTNGWRENADQEDDLVNAFVQYQLTPQTSVQAEFRFREQFTGDTTLRFFADDFQQSRRIDRRTKTVRVGFHHTFAPGSDLIGNFVYQNSDFRTFDPFLAFPFGVDSEDNADSIIGEFQYLFRSDYVNFVTGAGVSEINQEEIETILFFGFPAGTSSQDEDANHVNLYLYSYIKPLDYLTLIIGVSGDILDRDDSGSKEQGLVNPKFGIIYEPGHGTTLRAAAFKSLKRTLITQQTLEPTQVAGFNQFFDDINATDFWRYGGAIDQKFSKSLFGGIEYSIRNLDVPLTTAGAPVVEWDEETTRAYLFWTPHDWLSLTAEYQYEELDRRTAINEGVRGARTHWVPLGINFFHPSGLSASLKGTYVDQKGKFETRVNSFIFQNAQDTFWLVDAAIKYRFPKRYGFLSIGASNIFREEFQHFDTDFNNPRIQPDRFLFVSVTLNLP